MTINYLLITLLQLRDWQTEAARSAATLEVAALVYRQSRLHIAQVGVWIWPFSLAIWIKLRWPGASTGLRVDADAGS